MGLLSSTVFKIRDTWESVGMIGFVYETDQLPHMAVFCLRRKKYFGSNDGPSVRRRKKLIRLSLAFLSVFHLDNPSALLVWNMTHRMEFFGYGIQQVSGTFESKCFSPGAESSMPEAICKN